MNGEHSNESAETHFKRGNTLFSLNRFEEALAIIVNPRYTAGYYHNRGHVLLDLNRQEEALVSFGRALEMNPNHEFFLGTYVEIKMKMCD